MRSADAAAAGLVLAPEGPAHCAPALDKDTCITSASFAAGCLAGEAGLRDGDSPCTQASNPTALKRECIEEPAGELSDEQLGALVPLGRMQPGEASWLRSVASWGVHRGRRLEDDRARYLHRVEDVVRISEDEVHLHLTHVASGQTAVARLLACWADTLAEPRDPVHIIPDSPSAWQRDGDGTQHITLSYDTGGLLVLHPDVLVSGTSITAALRCPRQALLQDKCSGGRGSVAAVVGTMMHELVQVTLQAVMAGEVGEGGGEATQLMGAGPLRPLPCPRAHAPLARHVHAYMLAEIPALAERHVVSLSEVGLNQASAEAKLRAATRMLAATISQHVRAAASGAGSSGGPPPSLEGLMDIEECVWSPKFGLKGVVDVTAVARVASGHGPEAGAALALSAVEFKSGKEYGGHAAQVQLYGLLLEDRYGVSPAPGLLWYSSNEALRPIKGQATDLSGLMGVRNRLAAYKAKAPWALPPPIQKSHVCSSCMVQSQCTLVHLCLEEGSEETFGDPLFGRSTAHITPAAADFFRHWTRLLHMEQSASKTCQADIWAKTPPPHACEELPQQHSASGHQSHTGPLAAEREVPAATTAACPPADARAGAPSAEPTRAEHPLAGRCIGDLQLQHHLPLEPGSDLYPHTYTFTQRAEPGTRNLRLDKQGFSAGVTGILSVQHVHAAVNRVRVAAATADVLRLECRSQFPPAVMAAAAAALQRDTAGMNAAGAAGQAPRWLWRLDKDSTETVLQYVLGALMELMAAADGHVARLRGLIVGLEAPGRRAQEAYEQERAEAEDVLDAMQQEAMQLQLPAEMQLEGLGAAVAGKRKWQADTCSESVTRLPLQPLPTLHAQAAANHSGPPGCTATGVHSKLQRPPSSWSSQPSFGGMAVGPHGPPQLAPRPLQQRSSAPSTFSAWQARPSQQPHAAAGWMTPGAGAASRTGHSPHNSQPSGAVTSSHASHPRCSASAPAWQLSPHCHVPTHHHGAGCGGLPATAPHSLATPSLATVRAARLSTPLPAAATQDTSSAPCSTRQPPSPGPSQPGPHSTASVRSCGTTMQHFSGGPGACGSNHCTNFSSSAATRQPMAFNASNPVQAPRGSGGGGYGAVAPRGNAVQLLGNAGAAGQVQRPLRLPQTTGQMQGPLRLPQTAGQVQGPMRLPQTAGQVQGPLRLPQTAGQVQGPLRLPQTTSAPVAAWGGGAAQRRPWAGVHGHAQVGACSRALPAGGGMSLGACSGGRAGGSGAACPGGPSQSSSAGGLSQHRVLMLRGDAIGAHGTAASPAWAGQPAALGPGQQARDQRTQVYGPMGQSVAVWSPHVPGGSGLRGSNPTSHGVSNPGIQQCGPGAPAAQRSSVCSVATGPPALQVRQGAAAQPAASSSVPAPLPACAASQGTEEPSASISACAAGGVGVPGTGNCDGAAELGGGAAGGGGKESTQEDGWAGLTDEQKQVVDRVLSWQDYVLVVGLPGAGKTTTICSLVKILVSHGRSVLLSAYTNAALDHLLLKLLKSGFTDFLRLGRSKVAHPDLQDKLLHRSRDGLSSQDQADKLMPLRLRQHVQRVPVVGVTCLSAAREPLLRARLFDVCILDEATQVHLPASLSPILRARTFALVGDHKQLPPLVESKDAEAAGMSESLFVRLCKAHEHATVQLTRQFRMCQPIMDLNNELTYDGKLQAGSQAVADARMAAPALEQALTQQPSWLRAVLDAQQPLVWLDTAALPIAQRCEEPSHTSYINQTEANLCHRLLSVLLHGGVDPSSIGVTAPYSQQVEHVRGLLSNGECESPGAPCIQRPQPGGKAAGMQATEMEATQTTSRVGCQKGIEHVDGAVSALLEGGADCPEGLPPAAGMRMCGVREQTQQPSLADVVVNTVDKFQGQDKPVMILSLVRSNAAGCTGVLLKDARRVNVALTRAMHKLVLIGDSSTVCEVPILRAAWEGVQRFGSVVRLEKLDTPASVALGRKGGQAQQGCLVSS